MTHLRSPRSRLLVIGALLGGLFHLGSARAATLAHCDFSDVSSLSLNGSADQLGSDLELTTPDTHLAGSAYDMTSLPWSTSTSFHTSFQFVLENAGGAEGIAFILQGAGLTSLGGDTGQMGYGDIPTSVEVEFDTYKDAWDPNDNHVGIMENGAYKDHLVAVTPTFSMAGSAMLYAWIDYDASDGTLSVYLSQTSTKPSSPLASTVVTLAADLGAMAFAGFTAATGGGANVNEQDVLEWELSTDGVPCVCGGNADCPSDATCSPSAGICLQEVQAADAGADASEPPPDAATDAVPDAHSNACVTNASCDSSLDSKTPICGASLSCEACTSDSDCVAPLAPFCATDGPYEGQCVECITNGECEEDLDAGEPDARRADAGRVDADALLLSRSCVDNGLTNVCTSSDAGVRHDAGGARDAGVDAAHPHDGGRSGTDAGSNGESFAGGACSCRAAGPSEPGPRGEWLLMLAALTGLARRKSVLGRSRGTDHR